MDRARRAVHAAGDVVRTLPESETLRALFPITSLSKGGAERFLLDYCHALRRRGVDVLIAPLGGGNEYPDLSAGLPIAPLDYQTFSFRRPSSNPRWLRLLDTFRPHVVHSHLFLAEFLTAESVRSEIAYVCHGHDNMAQFGRASARTFMSRDRFLMWLERRRLMTRKYNRVPTAFAANSTHTLQYFRRVLPRRMRSDVRLLHIGFDLDRFRSAPRSLRVGQPVRLINVGSFVEKKNQQLLVRIGRALADRGVAFRIDFLGDGPDRTKIRALAESLGLSERVSFHGNVERVEEFLRAADLYVHTARYEPFGLAIVEAMAAGLPCIVRDGLGDRELVIEGENGHMLDHEDAPRYAETVVAIAGDAERYARMSARAIRFAERFHIDGAVDRFLALYDERIALTRAGRVGGA